MAKGGIINKESKLVKLRPFNWLVKFSLCQRLNCFTHQLSGFFIPAERLKMIVKRKLQKDFTVVSNEIMRHKLSLKAIGLYLYIINKPDNWDFSISGTATQVQDGHESIRTAIIELEEKGFLKRTRVRKSDGRYGDGIWEIYDKPLKNPTAVTTTQGKSRQVNTKEVNTKRESGTHTLKLSKEDVDQLMYQYGVTGKALSKVGQKYRNWCDDKNKKLSLAGFKLFLTREHWEIEDFQPDKQMEMQMRGEI